MIDQWIADIWSNDFYRHLVQTILILAAAVAVRRAFRWAVLSRLPDTSPYIYTIRKIAGFAINLLAGLLIVGVWAQRAGDLSVALGILAAGLAFALQEVIGSMAGWVTIVFGQPFAIGDRIETGGIRGDVIDITILRTKLMEIGNWLGGDHNTGRIVTVSNANIFKEPLFNYSRYLEYVWDEIDVPVTYESDWESAIKILTATVTAQPIYQEMLPRAAEQRRRTRREFAIKITPLDPRVFVRLTDNWIELGLVYPITTDARRTFRSIVSQEVLKAFRAAGIEIASQTMAIVRLPETARDRQAPPQGPA